VGHAGTLMFFQSASRFKKKKDLKKGVDATIHVKVVFLDVVLRFNVDMGAHS